VIRFENREVRSPLTRGQHAHKRIVFRIVADLFKTIET
jgi:hypothetical protein